jgi:hypothetical protein
MMQSRCWSALSFQLEGANPARQYQRYPALLPTKSFQLAQVQEIAHVVEWPVKITFIG